MDPRWIYSQRTGVIYFAWGTARTPVGQGYAGKGEGKNNPDSQATRNIGPLPQGRYDLSTPITHPTKGPCVIVLVPAKGNKMYGRSGFLIHGDSISNPGGASEGCVILPRAVRELIASSSVKVMEVVG